MPLTRWTRATVLVLGLTLVGVGIVGAVRNWQGTVILVAGLLAGVFLFISGLAGAFPKGSFTEGSIEFPDVDKHPRVEKIETEIAASREQTATEVAALRAEVATARKEAKDATDFLIDYILAHEAPVEVQGDDGEPLTDDEERLRYLERAEAELSHEIAGRYFTGETYDDGYDVRDMEKWRDELRRDLAKEERRQRARVRFGLPLNNEGQPVTHD